MAAAPALLFLARHAFPIILCAAGLLSPAGAGAAGDPGAPGVSAPGDSASSVDREGRADGAFRWSLWGTLVPVLGGAALSFTEPSAGVPLAAAGVLVGPSAGYFHGGLAGRGWGGIGIRTGIVAGAALGGAAVLAATRTEGNDMGAFWQNLGRILIVGGVCGLAAGTVVTIKATHDIVTVKEKVLEHERQRARVSLRLLHDPRQGRIGVAAACTF